MYLPEKPTFLFALLAQAQEESCGLHQVTGFLKKIQKEEGIMTCTQDS